MDFLLPRTSIELYVLASMVHQIFPRLVVWLAFHQMALRLCKTLLDSTKRTLNIIFNNAGYANKLEDNHLSFFKTIEQVGFFRISRTIKGKRTPPACKENRSTGELSFLTSLMNSAGSMVRVFISLQENAPKSGGSQEIVEEDKREFLVLKSCL
ncbi:hypothetical protein AHAS_Ahas06G0165800 [Arachis hypogaea]